MQGYRTIICNVVALLAVWLNEKFGIALELQDQEALVATIIIVGNIYLRLKTTTPVFKKESSHELFNTVSQKEVEQKTQNH